MFLEINDTPVVVTPEMIQKEFPELVGTTGKRPYIFAIKTITPDPDNPGQSKIPFEYIPCMFTAQYNGGKAKFRNYDTKVEQGLGKEPIYSPDTIPFDRTGQLIIDLSEDAPEGQKDPALVYMLLKSPKLNGIYELMNFAVKSQNRLDERANRAKAINMIVDKNYAGYLSYEQLIKLARKMKIASAEAHEEPVLRDIVSTIAETKYNEMLKLVVSEDSRYTEALQEALDYKVIIFDKPSWSYYFTYRPDNAVWQTKTTVGEPFYKATPNYYHDPIAGLQNFVTLQENIFKGICDALKEERMYLQAIPTRGQQQAIHLAKNINVSISEE